MSEYMIGIDIGGTSIKFGLFTTDGELLHKWNIPTRTEENGSFILQDTWMSIKEILQLKNIATERILGIGAGIPGFVSSDEGIVYYGTNIGWRNKQFTKELSDLSGLPVFIENDANMAVLGENWQGAGDEGKHVIAVTLGTGVGAGIIANGAILNGINGMAGELGHILIEENGAPCNCGKRGCLETIASATGIVRLASESSAEQPGSALAKMYEETNTITAKDVFQMAEKGDAAAMKIVTKVAAVLGRTFADLGVILNPEKILIGGGVSQAGEPFINQIRTSFEDYALPRVKANCEIKQAVLGNDAGIIGAAFYVKQNMEGS
ncbi:ROK family glucokinase [Oceanobacillus alkalisoli]|uniref:ROK family glucokinase n=1 Tax=Oceanobacillus alkalisoli TaxID=2925113 RepID=UPI001EF0A1F9|nr:ROK family glucokinase [Oceanobacillus alkalisoli]MCF3941771.1 ROK family glucokinase [Oceanobacillus alkalisoli]MCG5103051.1 ROK family glucokinase [Oceanobacillus alkalisoli]